MEVECDVLPRLGAAQQHVAVGWRFKRFGLVADLAADEAALAGVADAGAATEAGGDVACFGELEQAAERRVPVDREVAAAELDERPGV